MTSSRSCSSSTVALALLLAGGCAAAPVRQEARPPARVAVLPVENLSGAVAPARAIQEALALAVARAGVEVVGGDLLDAFLARHWVRYTGGVDAETARSAREELGVDALLLTSLELHSAGTFPRVGLGARLVAAEDRPRILWVSSVYRWGDEAPGLLGLGLVHDMDAVRSSAIQRLARGLGAYLESSERPPPPCPAGRPFQPHLSYSAHRAPAGRHLTVMVVPFLSRTDRPSAAQAVAAEMVRSLEATGRFEVVEPGLVREELLRNRVVTQGGVALDTVRPVLAQLPADLVLTGTVFRYEDGEVASAVAVEFSLVLLDRETGRIVWAGTSTNGGLDDEFLFEQGRIRVAAALACRMASSVAVAMADAAGAGR